MTAKKRVIKGCHEEFCVINPATWKTGFLENYEVQKLSQGGVVHDAVFVDMIILLKFFLIIL